MWTAALVWVLTGSPAESLLPLERLEVQACETPSPTEWEPFPSDTRATPWRRARGTLRTGVEEAGAGEWLLVVAGPAKVAAATLDDTPLIDVSDPLAEVPELAAGSLFRVPASLAPTGDHRVQLEFLGEEGGRGFTADSAYLVSPLAATRLRERWKDVPASFPVASLGVLASVSASGALLGRVCFPSPDAGGALRLAALTSLCLAGPDGGEIPVETLPDTGATAEFPQPFLRARDPSLPHLGLLERVVAPLVHQDLAACSRPAVFGTLSNEGQRALREQYDLFYHLRVFPFLGGPFHAAAGQEVTVLWNDRFCVFATKAEVLGSPDHPTGLRLSLSSRKSGGKDERMRSMIAGPRAQFGILALPGTLPADAVVKHVEESLESAGHGADSVRFGAWLAMGPEIGGACAAGPLSRRLAQEALADLRPGAGGGTRTAGDEFWAGVFPLLHLGERERRDCEAALDQAGAADGSTLEAQVFAALRCARYAAWYSDAAFGTATAERLLALLDRIQEQTATWDASLLAGPAPSSPFGGVAGLGAGEIAALCGVGELLRAAGREQQAADLAARAEERSRRLAAWLAETRGWPQSETAAAAAALWWKALPEEAHAVLLEWLEERLPEVPVAADVREAVLLTALLREGRVTLALPRYREVCRALESSQELLPAGRGAFFGTFVFGFGGLERPAPDELVILPRHQGREPFAGAVPLPDGLVRFEIGEPNVQFERDLSIKNSAERDYRVTLGVIGGLGTGGTTTTGDMVHSLYTFATTAGEWTRQVVR